jgi:hypothetical protein
MVVVDRQDIFAAIDQVSAVYAMHIYSYRSQMTWRCLFVDDFSCFV